MMRRSIVCASRLLTPVNLADIVTTLLELSAWSQGDGMSYHERR